MKKPHDQFHPVFVERYQKLLSPQELDDFLSSCLKDSPKSIRVNTLRISVEDFKERAKKNNWELIPIPWENTGFWINRDDTSIPLGATIEHQAGLFYVQDASSMLPVSLLTDVQKKLVGDFAAAPGSKTGQLAAKMENTGEIIALELSPKRIQGLTSNLRRLGIFNTFVCRKNILKLNDNYRNSFDVILLDAPCSSEGLMRRKPEIRKSWDIKNIHLSAHLQRDLIEIAFKALKPGGTLIYSTCTLAPEEDEEVVDSLLKKYPGEAEIVDITQNIDLPHREKMFGLTQYNEHTFGEAMKQAIRFWPHVVDSEGFFVCGIRKIRSNKKHALRSPRKHFAESDTGKVFHQKEIKAFEAYLRKHFGGAVQVPKRSRLRLRKHQLYLQTELPITLYEGEQWQFEGLHIANYYHNSWSLSHEAALLWGQYFEKNCVDLNEKQAQSFMRGKDLTLDGLGLSGSEEGQVLLKYDSIALGLGLLQEKKIKNQLPREYVIRSSS